MARWSLLAYVVIAGIIEYAFLRNHVRGGTLVILTLSLVVFAVHVPTLVGFTVARYYDVEPEDHGLAWSLYFADPDGNPWEITCWQHAVVATMLQPTGT